MPPRRSGPRRKKRASPKSLLWIAAREPHRDDVLLLDTHIWIWMLEGNFARVSPATAALLQRANAAGRVFVCDISFWEVAVKTAKGQLTLTVDAAVWLDRAARAPGIRYIPLDRSVLIQSTRLDGDSHGDPADRMLIAAAQLHGLSLVTVDAQIIAYAAGRPTVAVCDARAGVA